MANVKKHIVLANKIRRDILTGKYGTEGGLPGLDELVRQSGLARNTVRSALLLLEGERVIVERDRNYFVNIIPTVMTQYVSPVAARMSERRRKGQIRNISVVRRMPLPEYIANKLNVEHNIPVVLQLCLSVELVEGNQEKPMQMARYYYLMPVTDDQVEQMNTNATYDILLEAPPKLSREDEIFPRFPTSEESAHLSISDETPVLNTLSTVRDNDGNVLLFQDLVRVPYAVLKYQYEFENRPKQQ